LGAAVCAPKPPELRQALAGVIKPHCLILGQILTHIDFLEQTIAQMQAEVQRCLPRFEEALELLGVHQARGISTTPGCGTRGGASGRALN
jgi:hypothetical protein